MLASTTHVFTGAILGIGGADRSPDRRTGRQILVAWVVTLPLAAGIGATLMWWRPWL